MRRRLVSITSVALQHGQVVSNSELSFMLFLHVDVLPRPLALPGPTAACGRRHNRV
jgi:hypothetical protein